MIPVAEILGDDLRIRLVDALITLTGGIFAWAVFGLLKPRHVSTAWATARSVGIPVLWVTLVVGLAVFLCRLHQANQREIEERMHQLAPQIVQA